MTVALIAALAMVATDIAGTVMVMAEAKERGWIAGFCDCAGWYVSIATTTITVTSLQGHNTMQKVWVLLFVGAANIFGTKLGVMTGKALMRRFPGEKPVDPVTVRSVRR